MLLGADDLPALARGCSFLGSGGGGDVSITVPVLRHALESGPVAVLPPGECDPSTPAVLVGAIGSTTVMRERLPTLRDLTAAVHALEAYTGRRYDVLAPIEIGGLNALLAVAAAAVSGRPLIDCDAMGRAFPRLNSTVLAGHITPTPMALAGPTGMTMLLDHGDADATEDAVRRVLPVFGGWAAMAVHPTTAGELAQHAVTGSVSRALLIGRSLPGNEYAGLAPAATVAELRRRPGGGTAVLQVTDRSTIRVEFEDEIICATVDGLVVGEAPDILCLVDQRDHEPVVVDRLALGQRVRLVRIPAPPEVLRASDALGLQSYGYEPMGRHG